MDESGSGNARRHFLKRLGGACGIVAMRSLSAAEGLPEQRQLSFLHTHTGERLETRYFEAGAYRPEALVEVNHFLRDFRTGDEHAIDPGVLDILALLQARADRTAVFEVISGYRSPATNAMLRSHSDGVAQHSMHLLGRAIDVRMQGFDTRQLSVLARALQRGGVGYYATSDFVHVDTGLVRAW